MAHGFTILEVAIATFVLGFAITSAIVALRTGLRGLDTARGVTLASQVLQSEMERLRLMSWAEISALPASGTVNIADVFTTDPDLADNFTLERTVSDVPGHDGQMKEIVLTVTWTSYDGSTQSRSFRTRYAEGGLYDYYYTMARS